MLRLLGRVPDGDDPDDVTSNVVDESVWPTDDFALRKIRELWKAATRSRESLELET
jgi:hypothetical protein